MTYETLTGWRGQLPTPSYVYSQELFAQRALQVKEAFGDGVALCFSIKANPFLLPVLPPVFSKIEVCSPGELTICEQLHMDMDKVIFSGVNKTPEDVARAMEDRVGIFTIESFRHLELIHEEALRRDVVVPVLVRIAAGSQFGMDEADVLQIFRDRHRYPHIRILGIHYFTGTQKRKSAAILKELDYISSFLEKAKAEADFTVQKVEYGTGLAVDYFSAQAEESESLRLEEIAPGIRALGKQAELTVEMGRFFAAPCGFYFTQVMDLKTNGGVHYAILDGGLNQLKYDGQIQGMQIPVITHLKTRELSGAEKCPWTLCGSLCTTADVLARNVEFENLEIGDVLVFHRTGAYSVMEGMTTFLSREAPAIAIDTREHGLQIVREMFSTSRINTSKI